MSELTREQIEGWRNRYVNLTQEQWHELCDLALAALAQQEAVRKGINFVVGEPSENEARRASEVIAESKALLNAQEP